MQLALKVQVVAPYILGFYIITNFITGVNGSTLFHIEIRSEVDADCHDKKIHKQYQQGIASSLESPSGFPLYSWLSHGHKLHQWCYGYTFFRIELRSEADAECHD